MATALRWSPSVKRALRKTWVLDLISRLTSADRVEILLYHGFCEGSTADARFRKLMPIQRFEEQIRILAKYGRPLSLEGLADRPARGIIVTFDDGYANNYRLAFPVLQKYRFPATVLVTTGFLDGRVALWGDWVEFLVMTARPCKRVFEWRGARIALDLGSAGTVGRVVAELKGLLRGLAIGEIHEFLRNLEGHLQVHYDWDVMPEALRPLNWDEVRAMRSSGLVSFGAHTVSHPVLSRCTREVQRSEVVESKQRLEEELGEKCAIFAYPHGKRGDYTDETKQIVREAGYRLAVTAESGFNRPSSCDLYELKRWGADISDDELSFVVSGGPVVAGRLRGQMGR